MKSAAKEGNKKVSEDLQAKEDVYRRERAWGAAIRNHQLQKQFRQLERCTSEEELFGIR